MAPGFLNLISSALAAIGAAQPALPPPAIALPVPRTEPARQPTGAAFADLSDAAVFARAAAALDDIDTLQARFIQASPSGATYEGTLSLDRPGRLRFEYDAPNPQLIVAVGGLVYVHDAELETTDTYPVGETPLKFLLERRLDREAAVLEDVQRTDQSVTVRVAAADEDLEGALAMTFSAPDFSLTGWAVHEPNGSVTEVRLVEVEQDVRLSPQLFRAPDAGGVFLRE